MQPEAELNSRWIEPGPHQSVCATLLGKALSTCARGCTALRAPRGLLKATDLPVWCFFPALEHARSWGPQTFQSETPGLASCCLEMSTHCQAQPQDLGHSRSFCHKATTSPNHTLFFLQALPRMFSLSLNIWIWMNHSYCGVCVHMCVCAHTHRQPDSGPLPFVISAPPPSC